MDTNRPSATSTLLILVSSLLTIIVAMFWTWHIGMANAKTYHKVYHADEELTSIRQSLRVAHGEKK